jgi:hypothetical protein
MHITTPNPNLFASESIPAESVSENNNLYLTFLRELYSIGLWATISYGNRILLIPPRKQIDNEKRCEKDKIDFDSYQYIHEFPFPHILKSLEGWKKVLRLLRMGLVIIRYNIDC